MGKQPVRDVGPGAKTAPAQIVARPMVHGDAAAVLRIYQQGIDSGHATFQASAGDWPEWDAGHLADPRLVAAHDGTVVAWAGVSSVSGRCVYGGVAEVSIYVGTAARGLGVGRHLLSELLGCCDQAGLWTLQAGIFPENVASVAVHRDLGFRVVGIRERLGRMTHGPLAGQWRDVLLMERRSTAVGC